MTHTADAGAVDAPIAYLRHSHQAMLERLARITELPGLVTAAVQAQDLARDVVALFDGTVLEHHADEERTLFPAVLAAAQPGGEAGHLREMVDRLVAEHRAIEAHWDLVAPPLRAMVRGRFGPQDLQLLQALVASYREHARFEEDVFFPLAEQIAARQGDEALAAVGAALQARHAQSAEAPGGALARLLGLRP